jgi:hypothetical protein
MNEILPEQHLTVLNPVGCQSAEGLGAPVTRILVGGRDHAAGTRLGNAKIDIADPHLPPTVLRMGRAPRDDDVGSKPVHRRSSSNPVAPTAASSTLTPPHDFTG